ncbi:MAG TPA: hypothetical protein PK514_06930 [Spirochaetota bacterium]|nr:hypothetical protein [Spirochaetota bacterium]
MNYQQIGLRPEIKLWKLGIGLDINLLFDDEGKVREEDWDDWKDYLDKIYYIRWGQKGDSFYFRYGGLVATTLGYGTLISGYTNMLEYPTYKRQGLELGVETQFMGMEFIANDLKELAGGKAGFMGGGRIYIKPFSRLQIGGSIAGDLNEYKGLRDTDGDGIPDEMDAYPEDDDYATEIEYYQAHGITGDASAGAIHDLVVAGLLSPIERADLMNVNKNRSTTGFWAMDAGLNLFNLDFFKIDVYTQYAMCLNTGGWGYTLPGVRIKGGSLFEIYGDYRQQSDEFIFGYYNDTYDLERAKYVQSGTDYIIQTKKDKLEAADEAKGYMAGMRINLFELAYGKIEYQDMRWGDLRDKSLKGEIAMNKNIIPMVSKAKAYYAQNNVNNFRLKSESTIMGAVLGIGMSENVSIDFNYLITFQDKDGNGIIEGSDETITNISVSTTTVF